MSERISIAEAARRSGVQRAQIQRLIRDRRLIAPWVGPDAVGRVSLRAEGIEAHLNEICPPRIDGARMRRQQANRRAAQAPPAPVVDDRRVLELEAQVSRLSQQLKQAQQRDRAWTVAYDAFRGWAIDGHTMDLLKSLPDPAPIGDVMVTARKLLNHRLIDLDDLQATAHRLQNTARAV